MSIIFILACYLYKVEIKIYKMKKILFILFLLPFVSNAQDITLHGASFKRFMKVKESQLVYNGAGLRQKFGLDLYVSALYLPKKNSIANQVINANEMQAIQIKIISNLVTRDKFNQVVAEGFENSSHGTATNSERETFKGFFSADIKKGDDILLLYKPGKGVAAIINGKFMGKVEGIEFKKALWAIWLGDKPANDKLKSKMLGNI